MTEQEYLDNLHVLQAKNWPVGLPREINYPFGEIPFSDYLQKRAEQMPDKPAVIFYGSELSFAELNDLSDRFAAYLAQNGAKKGDRVAVFLPNCPQFLIAFFGILKLACVHVPVNPMFKEGELLYELNDTEAEFILCLDQLHPLVTAVKERTKLKHILTTSFKDFEPEVATIPVPENLFAEPLVCADSIDFMSMLNHQRPTPPPVVTELDDIAAINYTGGTTGLPKGCVHTQRDMVYTAATAATFGMPTSSDDVCLNFLPIFWIAGEDLGILLPVFTGMPVVLMARWDPLGVLNALQTYKVTSSFMLVDNVVELMEHERIREFDLSSLKTLSVASFVKKLNVEYRAKWRELTGCVLREGAYGMTETHTVDTFTTGMQTDDMDLKSQPVFCGIPMPGTDIKIVDFKTKELVPLGKEGEILVRSPSNLKEYWNKPEETASALRNGWLHTGDTGSIDELGYFHFLGRKKEMLKVNGMSVFPAEVEALLGQHPAITGSAVIGQDDPEKGQIPVAFITLREDQAGLIDEQKMVAWCRENMAIYKVPVVRFLPQLPLTATGKVMKEKLKPLLQEAHNPQAP